MTDASRENGSVHRNGPLRRLRYCYEIDEEDEQFIREHLFTLDSSVSTPQVVIDVFEGANPFTSLRNSLLLESLPASNLLAMPVWSA
jgi:hypothetical protein